MYSMPVGTRSTYQIDGMADMSPDEYIDALNQRTVDFQRQRRRNASKSPTRDYFSTLD